MVCENFHLSFFSLPLFFAGKIGCEFSDWATGTKRSASMATTCISLFSEFSNYRSVLGISVRCHVRHATTSGKMRRQVKINFSTFHLYQPQFLLSRLLYPPAFAFALSLSPSHFHIAAIAVCEALGNTDDLIYCPFRNALKHFVTSVFICQKFSPFVSTYSLTLSVSSSTTIAFDMYICLCKCNKQLKTDF